MSSHYSIILVYNRAIILAVQVYVT